MNTTMSHVIERGGTLLRREPFGTVVGLVFLAMTLPTLAGLALDGRSIAEVSVWLKPLKFQLSFALLKSSYSCGEEHEVVGEDTQDELAALRLMSSRGQR